MGSMARRWLPVMLLAAPFAGCGVSGNIVFGTGSTGAGTGSGGDGGPVDGGGADCTPDAGCGAGEVCDVEAGVCSCPLGAVRCSAGDPASEQVCVAVDGGTNHWQATPCGPGASCSPDVGKCACAPDACTVVGDFACDSDNDTVLTCQMAPPLNCVTLGHTLKCSEQGLANGCVLPPQSTMVTDAKQMCVNECNVRGVPLTGALCGPVPGFLCAVLTCNQAGTALVSDHITCKGGGIVCGSDSECASCNCAGGLCLGSFINHCPSASLCP
jgi:hypothetical protein